MFAFDQVKLGQVWRNNEIQRYTNLRFLRRQAYLGNVESVEIMAAQNERYQGVMTATLKDGRIFKCSWVSLKLCASWLARPSLIGVRVFWINHSTTCDKLKYYHFGDKIRAKRILDSTYRAFVEKPSADNYIILQQRMLTYQDVIKNQEPNK